MSPPDSAARTESRKDEIRRAAHAARRQQPDKDAISRKILARAGSLTEYRAASTVVFYIDVRDEVRTRPELPAALESDKRIVVPYCVAGSLRLFWLQSIDELEPGAYGILEPRANLRSRPEKQVALERIDLILVPGLAFDRDGGRIGYGKGYYDRLLATVGPDTRLVALAFECQIFDSIPMQPHDIHMDMVVTQSATYRGRGRT